MDEHWKQLYLRLNRETDQILQSGPGDESQVEKCFKVCLQTWQTLKKLTLEQGFATDAEEIAFFRDIKPLFMGLIEYYTLLYSYYQFCPSGEEMRAHEYRTRELRKIGQFREAYGEFIRYYHSGRRDEDARFFLRRNYNPDPKPYVRSFDKDPEITTNGDWMLTVLFGFERYEQFLSTMSPEANK
jgi:hypothetical protein